MKRYSYMDCRVGRPAFWCFLLAMLLLARDTLISSVVLGFAKSQFLMLGGIALVGCGFLFVQRNNLKVVVTDRRMGLMVLCAAVLLAPMVLKGDWQMMYFSILLCLLTAVFLSYFRSVKEVARVFAVLLTGLALWSVVTTYGLKGLAASGALKVPQVVNSKDWPFYNFGLSYVVTWEAWHRNFGIFREPGVYQFFLILGLYVNNYEADWEKNGVLWLINGVLAVTMLTTFSVAGIGVMGLLVLFVFFDKNWHRTRWGRIAAGAAVAGAAAFAGFFFWKMKQPDFARTVWFEVYDMAVRLFTDSESSSDRLGAVTAGLGLFAESPLLGSTVAGVLHAVENNTSSSLILYGILGILGGSIHVAAWGALAWRRERGAVGNLLLLGILFLSFNTQNLTADLFFWLFPMMALAERGLPLTEKRKKKV